MQNLTLKYGFLIAVVLILYFLLIRLLGLHHQVLLSAINGLIFGVGIFFILKNYKAMHPDMRYEKGFAIGFGSGVIATLIFTVFMAIYMYQIETDFSKVVMERWNMDFELSTFMLVVIILTIGAVTSLILTLTFMQLLKKSLNTKEGNRHKL